MSSLFDLCGLPYLGLVKDTLSCRLCVQTLNIFDGINGKNLNFGTDETMFPYCGILSKKNPSTKVAIVPQLAMGGGVFDFGVRITHN